MGCDLPGVLKFSHVGLVVPWYLSLRFERMAEVCLRLDFVGAHSPLELQISLTHSCPNMTRHKKLLFYCISIVSANIIMCSFSFNNIDGTFIYNSRWSLESQLGIGGYM